MADLALAAIMAIWGSSFALLRTLLGGGGGHAAGAPPAPGGGRSAHARLRGGVRGADHRAGARRSPASRAADAPLAARDHRGDGGGGGAARRAAAFFGRAEAVAGALVSGALRHAARVRRADVGAKNPAAGARRADLLAGAGFCRALGGAPHRRTPHAARTGRRRAHHSRGPGGS